MSGCKADAEARPLFFVATPTTVRTSTFGASRMRPCWGRTELRELVVEAFRDPAEAALLFFAGQRAVTQLGGYLVTPDVTSYGDGVQVSDVLAILRSSPVAHKAVLLDCCFSGAFGQETCSWLGEMGLPENTAVLTASLATQPAQEQAARGVFSTLLCAALEGGAADVLGKVTVASTYAYADEVLGPWDQCHAEGQHYDASAFANRRGVGSACGLAASPPVVSKSRSRDGARPFVRAGRQT